MNKITLNLFVLLLASFVWLNPVHANIPQGQCAVILDILSNQDEAVELAHRFQPYFSETQMYRHAQGGGYAVSIGIIAQSEVTAFFSQAYPGPFFPRTVECLDNRSLDERLLASSRSNTSAQVSPRPSTRPNSSSQHYELLITLALTFLSGMVLGWLTRDIGFWKIIGIFFFLSIFYQALLNAGIIYIFVFVAGFLTKHLDTMRRVFFWAGDIKDVFFAMRHRTAFEDIRRREEELEQRERAFREEQARNQAQNNARESASQRAWREETRKQRNNSSTSSSGSDGSKQQGRSKTSGANSSSAGTGRQRRSSENTTYTDPMRDHHLRILGLVPGRKYSEDDIKRAFRNAAMKAHPDAGGSNEAMRAVSAARDSLLKI